MHFCISIVRVGFWEKRVVPIDTVDSIEFNVSTTANVCVYGGLSTPQITARERVMKSVPNLKNKQTTNITKLSVNFDCPCKMFS